MIIALNDVSCLVLRTLTICVFPILSTLIVPTHHAAKMVNYQNPATIAGEFGACPFSRASAFLTCRPISTCLFNSGARQVLARPEWHIYVRLSLTVPPRHPPGDTRLHSLDTPLLDGNFSLPFIMSGILSEGYAPTDGRYGFVTFFSAFFPAHWHLTTED